jgi:hypothetical protein
MKAAAVLLLLLFAASTGAWAQEKPRKSLTFQPGAKNPDATATAAVNPAATPAPPAPSSPLPPGLDEPTQIATLFFALLQKNQVEEAYASLTRGSKFSERPEDVRNLKAKTSEAIQLFGEIQGSELIESKAVGANLLRRTYLSLGRDFPLRWRFYFYRTEKKWRLVDLRVDDRLGGIFEEPEEVRAVEPKP